MESWVRRRLRRACVSREDRQKMRGRSNLLTCSPRTAYRSTAKGSVVVVGAEGREKAKCDEDRETCDLASRCEPGRGGTGNARCGLFSFASLLYLKCESAKFRKVFPLNHQDIFVVFCLFVLSVRLPW